MVRHFSIVCSCCGCFASYALQIRIHQDTLSVTPAQLQVCSVKLVVCMTSVSAFQATGNKIKQGNTV